MQLKDRAQQSKMYSSVEFEEAYTYTGTDLGVTYKKSHTEFRVWAPTADAVSLLIYESGDIQNPTIKNRMDMEPLQFGVWYAIVKQDCKGWFYTYEVSTASDTIEACDPYAKAVGVNGDRAMVVDLTSTNPRGWKDDVRPHSEAFITDAIIYEVHVRDYTIDDTSGVQHKGKYLGLVEEGSCLPSGVSTGFDYIKSLGVTHVHLNPVYDYQTVDESRLDIPQYNWGYDPKNYNVPEGSYSTDPYDGVTRILELKKMVQKFHQAGIGVIVDLVYNHTNDVDYCFSKIVPDYFHRVKNDGTYSAGSACGNDVASERSMVSKFIVDSITYWAEEYHLDGFRFDLVGLTDIDTIQKIRHNLNRLHPGIIMYGEGWDMKTFVTKKNVRLATQKNAKYTPGMAYFSDDIRDLLKGRVFYAKQKGYINGNFTRKEALQLSIMGAPPWAPNPTAVVNYASCHDNLTLMDKISTSNPQDSFLIRRKQSMLAAAIVFTSQGCAFFLAGEEFLRTKPDGKGGYVEDSYKSPDAVNSIKWASLDDSIYAQTVDYYRGLIAFRKTYKTFRSTEHIPKSYTFDENTPKGLIAYALKANPEDEAKSFYVIYNAYRRTKEVKLPRGIWSVLIQGEQAGVEVLSTVKGTISVEGLSCTVLLQG